ncbi:histidine phosphatase family protein [Aquibacillus rhizosphaerae]|uniref:Histidine phosphatase family protein n=1 Tax=Aquibacillus rhizosphaerae TaxID=3051431 RepID=A0ABT7L546_9BACI|nr:histidine phosphatase family protein [Aquibacillus sp. LR5S19]MDL4839706.1 histidine phosphatase family protein [Aquibacillus sp. LR5S19]
MKRLFMIRHCNAEGQHKDSPLTKDGVRQSQFLSNILAKSNFPIDRIISSPFLRAIESIKPYAQSNNLTIEVDQRLQERMLSEEPIDDWMDVLEESFTNLDFRLPGGESSNDALDRSSQVIEEVLNDDSCENIVIVTHGNLLAILLSKFQADIGFSHWKEFTNPDIFMVQKTGGEYVVERIWNS